MNGRKTLASDRRRRKLITFLWMLGLTVLLIVLIYKEMSALLYILATLGITALLIVVALSNLDHSHGDSSPEAKDNQPAKADY